MRGRERLKSLNHRRRVLKIPCLRPRHGDRDDVPFGRGLAARQLLGRGKDARRRRFGQTGGLQLAGGGLGARQHRKASDEPQQGR
jgi:hypothetical protein